MAQNIEKAIVRYTISGSYKRQAFDNDEDAVSLYKRLNKNPQVHNLSIVY